MMFSPRDRKISVVWGWMLFLPGVLVCVAAAADDVEQQAAVEKLLAIVHQTGPNGAGSEAARRACDELSQHGLEILPQLLTALDTSNVIAANWLRTVADPMIERGLSQPDTVWPKDFLKTYVSDARRRGRPRELALGILSRLEPTFRDRWILTRLDDPAFRYEAVAATLIAAEKALADNQTEHATAEFRKAFRHARDAGQVSQAAMQLKALQQPVDVARHLGLIIDWRLLGPFDAPKKTGLETVFPPEESLDFTARYSGQADEGIRWISHQTTDTLGTVNLNEALTVCREAVGYAYSEIDVAAEQNVQLRCSADDNCTVWLNGRKVFSRDQWLNGTRFDRFTTPVTLQAGRNTVLVKICQGPQHRDPEVQNNWTFQLRFCDVDGLGIEFQTIK